MRWASLIENRRFPILPRLSDESESVSTAYTATLLCTLCPEGGMDVVELDVRMTAEAQHCGTGHLGRNRQATIELHQWKTSRVELARSLRWYAS